MGHQPYKVFFLLENEKGQYAIGKRKYTRVFSFPGGKEIRTDKRDIRTTGLRELCEETGITADRIELLDLELVRDSPPLYVYLAKMKKVENSPGGSSHDDDIEYYQWVTFDTIMTLDMTPDDTVVREHVKELLKAA
jgi:8-oxo-dGTP pyrophosphatase MutT (NUDIX family)